MRVTFEGFAMDARTRDMLLDARALCPAPMVITQGAYSTSVSASAGTHSGGGVIDIRARDLSTTQRSQVVSYMRRVGFAAWLRTPSQADWPYHVHAVAVGCPDLSSAAAAQVVDYKNNRNGLASNGPDDGPRTWVNVTWETYLKARGGISVTAYDELLGKINDQQEQINVLLARVTTNTNARAQYAYGQVIPGGGLYEFVQLIANRVTSNTDARAQYAYAKVFEMMEMLQQDAADDKAVADAVAALKAQVEALAPKA